MRRALLFLTSLYPRNWRNRYQSEYLALIEDVQPSWRTFFDVFQGALKMQMKMWSPWKIVPAFAVAGVVMAAAFSLTVPNRYRSTAVIKLEQPSQQIGTVLSRGGLTKIINEENLYQRERTHVPMEDVIETMKANIAITSAAPDALAISFTSENPAQARRTTERLAYAFNDSKTWALVEAPSPAVVTNPRRTRIIAMGAIAGILIGALFALFSGLKVWKMAAALGTAGALLFGAASFLLSDRYTSTVVLRYNGSDASLRPAVDAAMSADNLKRFASLFALYPNDPRAARKLSEHLHIEPLPAIHAVVLKFDYTDRYKAQKVAQRVAYQMMDTPGASLEMIDPASLPFNPYFPNRLNVALTGLLLGLLAAAVQGKAIRRRHS